MWGDPERAASLQGNDPLALLLFQIASPAHVPWGDSRWQELLLGYDVWVHIEENSNASPILTRACESMAKHAAVSSNLAGLCLHVTRMLRQLVRELQKSVPPPATAANNNNTNGKDPANAATSAFSSRISRVGKARATAGAMRLLRLLAHPVVVRSSSTSTDYSRSYLEDAMLYRTRGDLPADQPTARPLVYSILDLIVVAGRPDCDALETPEIYDAVVLAFHLLFVLCGTQLYQPFLSSFQIPADITGIHCVLEELFQEELSMEEMETRTYKLLDVSLSSNFSNHTSGVPKRKRRRHVWTPRDVLKVCLDWQIRRPPAPLQSITYYLQSIAETAASSSPNEKRGPDGLFESHTVVQATTPTQYVEGGSSVSQLPVSSTSGVSQTIAPHRSSRGPQMILDATKGVLMLGSSIMLLPIRLMQAVYHVLVPREKRSSSSSLRTFQRASSRTKDVLWLSDSLVADLACSIMLLLVNNYRNRNNPFRTQLVGMVDNRWEHESSADLFDKSIKESSDDGDKDDESIGMDDIVQADLPGSMRHHHHPETHFTINFEGLFVALGRTLHTEVGALFLYTLYQASPNFAQSLAVRSDLDTLVLPLLRTLYIASNTQSYTATEFVSYARKDKGRDIRSCPFRSHSQLYVNVILLLLFSQDTSFGRDAFERIQVPMVVWYKERHLRKINLGSVLLLTLLRTLVFHMDRMPDAFLLSNCCAILQNLSPAVVDLHEYAALRLVAVTVSILKKHARVAQRAATASAAATSATATSTTTGESTEKSLRQEDRSTTSVEMYEEIARSLLRLIHHCVLPKHLERNIHLVYMLVYHQSDVMKLLKHETALYPRKLVERILWVTEEASSILMECGARSTTKALKALEDQIERLLVENGGGTKKRKSHVDGNNEFTFSYQEEADPEIFFVPYVWETIVCVVTASSIEWQTNDIQAFALLDEPDPVAEGETMTTTSAAGTNLEGSNGNGNGNAKAYQQDAENMV
eukprot:Nitzschia sp. Nitz4//scaffold66_size103028//44609//47635//NITZ4_004498-RA/size103028-snap-gene-0.139-mRNA-1//-1//CDS//3329556350//4396//frame0